MSFIHDTQKPEFALSIQNLGKTYPNGIEALKGISINVKAGDFFALLGPNGAGKSTTIGILSSLVTKSFGSVQIFGIDLEKDPAKAKAYIGLVPQEFNFNQFEKVEQILSNQAGYYGVPSRIAAKRIDYYLEKLDLMDKKNTPAGYLSGGMKRRLMIARALIHEPQILILDEPTAGVDIEIRRSLWTFIKEINEKGITIILTTHYLEEAEQLCRNIAIINQGKIIENTNMKDLLKKLDKETFIFYLKTPLSLPYPDLKPFTVKWLDNTSFEINMHHSESLNDLFSHLNEAKIAIASFRNKTNRLEELFMSLIA